MTPRTRSPRTGSTAPSEISAQAFHWTAEMLKCLLAFCERMCESLMQLPVIANWCYHPILLLPWQIVSMAKTHHPFGLTLLWRPSIM